MIAKACGARVKTAPVKEIGWSEVNLTEEGRSDRLFHGVPENLPVLQWHEDTFDLPYKGVLLATSKECPHQAFRYKNAYGLQFHVEVTCDMLYEWFCESGNRERILKQFREKEQDYALRAEQIYRNFISLAMNRID